MASRSLNGVGVGVHWAARVRQWGVGERRSKAGVRLGGAREGRGKARMGLWRVGNAERELYRSLRIQVCVHRCAAELHSGVVARLLTLAPRVIYGAV